MIRRILGLLPVLLLPVAAHAANIFEEVTVAPILQMNPSVRWRAMGDAGTAGFWDPTHAWANPALLGQATGVQYETGSMDKDLIDFTTGRTTIGWGGIGVSTTGWPISGLGKIREDFGPLDVNVRSWSLGVSTSQVATTIARHRGHQAAAFTRWCDLAIGYSAKRVEQEFAFSDGTSYGSHVTASDLGALLRAGGNVGPARIDVAYGFAEINSDWPSLDLGRNERRTRNGVATRAGWDPPAASRRVPAWLRSATTPFASVSWAMDFVHQSSGGEGSSGWGAELALANVLFGRIGREEELHSWGLGAGLPLGPFAAVRYDHSYRSRFFGLPDERRDAWTVWMDPLAIIGAVR